MDTLESAPLDCTTCHFSLLELEEFPCSECVRSGADSDKDYWMAHDFAVEDKRRYLSINTSYTRNWKAAGLSR